MGEVITVMQASVHKSAWDTLKKTYEAGTINIPAAIRQTFLIQSQQQPQNWQIITHWRSQEDLDKMRSSVDEPVAVRIFKSVGATPHLEIWDSVVHHNTSNQ